jgi:hypothetical protein
VALRAIVVNTDAVGVVQFDAPAELRAEVVANGEQAAKGFLRDWDWDRYRRECRGNPASG